MSLDQGAEATETEAFDTLRGPRIFASLARSAGGVFRIGGVLRPVIALNDGVLRGRALVFSVREARDDGAFHPVSLDSLNAVDAERVTLMALRRAFEGLEPAVEAGRPPLIFLPLPWNVARNAAARRRVLKVTALAQVRLRSIAVCEITGVETGTPQSALREATGALQPVFRGVLARVDGSRQGLQQVLDCGFTGASVESAELRHPTDEPTVLRAVLSLQRVGPGVLIHAVRSSAALAAARAAGASWATLDITGGAAPDTKKAARSPEPPFETDIETV